MNILAVASSMAVLCVYQPSSFALASLPPRRLPLFPVCLFIFIFILRHTGQLTSVCITGIIREPLKGQESLCPIGDSLDSPELTALSAWLASPTTTIKNFVHAKHVPSSSFYPHTRVVCLPGFTASVKDELDALLKVAGQEALDRVKFKDDETNRRIVSSWPAKFDNTYPLSLGFSVDEGGMEEVVRQFQKDVAAGLA